jgi:hypothetical protein
MNTLFAQLTLADIHQDVARNIVSLRQSQDLFDDLSENAAECLLAQKVEDEVKPPPYRSRMPIIDRPFEDSEWFNAIAWPFKHWQGSRFSDGTFGVWYGSDSVETTVYESAYHWYNGLLKDAGFDTQAVVVERKVYSVTCQAALLDFRKATDKHEGLLHATDYSFCHSVGARIHREGHPGLVTPSVRRPAGENFAIFNSGVLSKPRHNCHLTYRLEGERIVVEKEGEGVWIGVDLVGFE